MRLEAFLAAHFISIHALLAESDRWLPRQCVVGLISIHALLAESDYTVNAKFVKLNTISIHALLAESDGVTQYARLEKKRFLSTLSLRRATFSTCFWLGLHANFYPRSPCGERLLYVVTVPSNNAFLSTLSLRRATHGCYCSWRTTSFLSTLSLRRATLQKSYLLPLQFISIHALLAESDWQKYYINKNCLYFYPRSPCGERRFSWQCFLMYFDFYPRSPCGERRYCEVDLDDVSDISIHALLAESDARRVLRAVCGAISIHALLAESDTQDPELRELLFISIHALLAESDGMLLNGCGGKNISIHALLAESDGETGIA